MRSSLRVVHATDIHFLVPPGVKQVLAAPKRLVGVSNLYLLQRASRFSFDVQQQLVESILSQKPDVVILSGDLTNLSLRSEFDLARRTLDPLLNNGGRFPTFVVPGNHDAYVSEVVEDTRSPPTTAEDAGTRGTPAAVMMREYFGPWMESMSEDETRQLQHGFSPDGRELMAQIQRQQRHFFRFRQDQIPDGLRRGPSSSSSSDRAPMPYLPVMGMDFLRIIGLNPCRPTWIGSNGEYDRRQLEAFQHWLRTAPQSDQAALDVWQQRTSQPSASELPPLPPTTEPLPFQSTFNLVVGHYPVLDGQGQVYEKVHKWHGVSNGETLIQTLQHSENVLKPQMFIHGHVHRGFQDQLPLPSSHPSSSHQDLPATSRHQMLILNPGSSGQSFSEEKKRCAAYNVYTIARGAEVKGEDKVLERRQEQNAEFLATPEATDDGGLPVPNRTHSLRTRSSASSEKSVDPNFLRANATGARGGIHTVHQTSADGKEKYYTSIERWTHDGQRFARELEPYISGY